MERYILREVRERRGLSKKALGDLVGCSGQHISMIEDGKRGITIDMVKRLSEALEIPVSVIMSGGHLPETPLIGTVGAGTEIHPLDGDETESVETPPSSNSKTVAVRVSGDSMRPAIKEGSVIYYSKHVPPKEIVNDFGVVKLKDGRIFVKVIHYGSGPDLWTLQSVNSSYPDMIDAALEWAAPIDWIKP